MEPTSSMSVLEAFDWYQKTSIVDQLEAITPEQEAWLNENDDSIQEALSVLSYYAQTVSARPQNGSIEHSGSLFSFDPPEILFRHQGFIYTVSNPQHVAVLHTIRDWNSALAYIRSHADSRVPDAPFVFTVPATWHPDVFPGASHPGERKLYDIGPRDPLPAALHDADAYPVFCDAKNASEAQGLGTVRYTLYGWQKRNAYISCQCDGWCTMQHYFAAHYDVKEILDSEGNVLSVESGVDHILQGLSRL
ncbi:hypothetical protein B0H16DRAFT_1875932 [Mycena metata]|uniref:Uncharacterized protein n=1 Tax=Mycena metata TaxID=1033252 RepID=A0AAD7KHD2_9AGAR|nr:hypothetical protein B0H16DRAFT_1875932 [Mycena metata]